MVIYNFDIVICILCINSEFLLPNMFFSITVITMDETKKPAAEQLKCAIEEYGKKKLYNELPKYVRNFKYSGFCQKVTRLKDFHFFTDSRLLFEVLKILGITFESLFNPETEESKIAFYLKKINANIEALRTEQQLNNWFEKNAFTNKPTPRSTLIIKLDDLLSIWYTNLFLIPAFINNFCDMDLKKKLIVPEIQIKIFPPNYSQFISDIYSWTEYINNFNLTNLFMYYYKTYSTKDRPKLNKLFALIGNNPHAANPFGFLGINYILLNSIQNYLKAFNDTPFVGFKNDEIEIDIYKNVKASLNTILKKFDEAIEFIDIRFQIAYHQDYKEAISDSIEQLIFVENFITNLLPAHIDIWKEYKETIENKILQQNEKQVNAIQNAQYDELLSIVKEIKKINLKLKGNEDNAVSTLRFGINKLLTSSTFGTQIITPITKLKYERYISGLLESTKLRATEKDTLSHFENKTIGYLERFKSYHLSEVEQ